MELYDRLSYLFGTDEYVILRREFVLIRESLDNHYFSQEQKGMICSGSIGEGIAYPLSDDDVMTYHTSHRVVKSYRDATQKYDLLMVPSEFSPGYCMLLDTTKAYPLACIHFINDRPFLSSSLWKLSIKSGVEILHGPCVSRKIGMYEYDNAASIPCSFWPDGACNWIFRNHSRIWPSRKMIQDIIMNGCHVVPIGDQTSLFCQHEWRISFSVAERTLMHSFNHVQFLTYNLLRLCLKRVIEKVSPGTLCSYFMKTTLFYLAENTPRGFWKAENIETCFRTCLSALYDYVEHGHCPNYFIPEYNMIKQKLTHVNRTLLQDIISSLHSVGITGTLHLCEESSCLKRNISLQLCELKQDFDFISSMIFAITLKSVKLVIIQNLKPGAVESHTHKVRQILGKIQSCSSKGTLNNIIFRTGVLEYSLKLITCLWNQLRLNKRDYLFHKTIQSLLRIGYKADLTSGKLTAATYMYMIGDTESALSHIRRLLSVYPPYVLDVTKHHINQKTYMDVMCCKGNRIDYKIQHAHSPCYELGDDNMNAFPCQLRIWISTIKKYFLEVDPLSYTYFLESLCYMRFQDRALLKKSTRCMVNRLDDLIYDTRSPAAIFVSNTLSVQIRMFIGIIKYAQDDSQSTCRWLGSVYTMKDTLPTLYTDELVYSLLTYIACLLNRRFGSEQLR